MIEYKVAVIMWEDHVHVERSKLPLDPDDLINATISIGLIVDETERVLVLAHDIERYDDRDDSTYTVILKGAIIGRKDHGKVRLEAPRR